MTIHIITPRTPTQQLAVTSQHPAVRIMMQRAHNTSEPATARMIECLAARLTDICARRDRRA